MNPCEAMVWIALLLGGVLGYGLGLAREGRQ